MTPSVRTAATLPTFIQVGPGMLWTGKQQAKGYGIVKLNGAVQLTHRRVAEMYYGPIPKGAHVRHHCDNPPCCNPDHLSIGTAHENAKDHVHRHGGHYAKLNADQVKAILTLRADGLSFRRIAAQFDVTHRTIMKIVQGRTYEHMH